MRGIGGRLRPRSTRGLTLVLVFALSLGLARMSLADAISPQPVVIGDPVNTLMGYSTITTVGTTGINGPSIIGFTDVTDASFTTPSAFSLGEFVSGALDSGIGVTYENTPFTVDLNLDGANEPIQLTGLLNGTVVGPTQNSVVATFDQVDPIEFLTIDGNLASLTILDPELSLVPSTTNGGRTTAQAQVAVTAVPEPATVAVFLTALTGLALRRRMRRIRMS